MVPTTDAFEVAISTIESRGLELEDPVEHAPLYRGFAFPNGVIGGFSSACIRQLDTDTLLEVSVRLTEGQVNPALRDGLLQLLNGLHFKFPGFVFTYEQDDQRGDEIELATSIPYVEAEGVAALLEDRLTRLQAVHTMSAPLILTYVTQRLRVRVGTDGEILGFRPTVSVPEVMDMLETGHYGTA
jgi:hypothetical protein